MNKYGFNLLWSDDDGGYIATCADFPGLSAFGETAEEALAEGKAALELFVESLQESGDPLPSVTGVADFSGQLRLRMPKTLHASLARQAEKEGVSLNTWIVTLLAERNFAIELADDVMKRIGSHSTVSHIEKPSDSKNKRSTDEIVSARRGEREKG